MQRLISPKTLKKRVWSVVSEYVRRRDGGQCVTCGKRQDWREMHCGHYRHNTERNQQLGGNALWYDLRNLNCQCVGCNTYRDGMLDQYAIFLETKYGHGILQEINVLYNTTKKWSREELLAKEQYFKNLIKKYG